MSNQYNQPTFYTRDEEVLDLETIRDAMNKVYDYKGDNETRRENGRKLIFELILTLSQYRNSGQKRLIQEIVSLYRVMLIGGGGEEV